MATDNVFTREEIERTITDRLRVRAVALGYLPDILQYQPPIVPVADPNAYRTARGALVTGGNELIDIFGIGGTQERGEKLYNRIYLNLRQFNNGKTNLWGDYCDVDISPLQDGTLFETQRVFGSTRNIIYDIRSVCEKTEYDRICTDIIMGAITSSSLGFPLFLVNPDFTVDPSKNFLIRYLGSQEIKTPKFFERLFSFEVIDTWVNNWDVMVIDTSIPPLTKVIGYGGPKNPENGLGGSEEIQIFKAE